MVQRNHPGRQFVIYMLQIVQGLSTTAEGAKLGPHKYFCFCQGYVFFFSKFLEGSSVYTEILRAPDKKG